MTWQLNLRNSLLLEEYFLVMEKFGSVNRAVTQFSLHYRYA